MEFTRIPFSLRPLAVVHSRISWHSGKVDRLLGGFSYFPTRRKETITKQDLPLIRVFSYECDESTAPGAGNNARQTHRLTFEVFTDTRCPLIAEAFTSYPSDTETNSLGIIEAAQRIMDAIERAEDDPARADYLLEGTVSTPPVFRLYGMQQDELSVSVLVEVSIIAESVCRGGRTYTGI